METNRPNTWNRVRRGVRRRLGRVSRLLKAPWTGLAGPLLFAPFLVAAFVAPVPGTAVAGVDEPVGAGDVVQAPVSRAADMEQRMQALAEEMDAMEAFYEARVAPIERTLLRFNDDRELARRIALALVREGEDAGIDPRVLVSVLLVENPWLDPDARSFVGAHGLMQVMPFHAGEWGCASDDLSDLDTNICHGARIFARYFQETDGDVDRALLRYNGCVRGTNTPNCHTYPQHVYARAGEAMVHGLLGERGS